MYSSRTGCLSPSVSPSCVPPAPLHATPLCGLGLSNCHLLPGANEISLKPSSSLGPPSGRYWLSNQAGQEQIFTPTEQNISASSCAATDLTSATTSSVFPDLVQQAATVAATYPTNAFCLEYTCSSGFNSFDSCQYRTASSLERQAPYYVTRSSAMMDSGYTWCNFETNACRTEKVASCYSTPLRLESPTMSHVVFAGSAPESPTCTVNPQSMPTAENYIGFDARSDTLQSQNRTKGYRAFSWPGDCPYLEPSEEVDTRDTKRRREHSPTASRRSCPSRNERSHVARGRDHRTTRARVRVACSYGNGCRQTFNRKTDLDRHINTVRRHYNSFHTLH